MTDLSMTNAIRAKALGRRTTITAATAAQDPEMDALTRSVAGRPDYAQAVAEPETAPNFDAGFRGTPIATDDDMNDLIRSAANPWWS